MRKKIISWIMLSIGAVVLVASICGFTQSLVYAEEGEGGNSALGVNLATARKNAYFKALYSNLNSCQNQLQSPIPATAFDMETTLSTIFLSTGQSGDFLKFPFDYYNNNAVVETTSSCAGLIDGWKTDGWIDSIFNDRGDYTGVLYLNENVSVPDGTMQSMMKFLENIGYRRSEVREGEKDERCFHLVAQFVGQANTDNPETTFRDDVYYSPDYCVKVDDQGLINQDAGITVKYGRINDNIGTEGNGFLEPGMNVFYPFWGINPGPTHLDIGQKEVDGTRYNVIMEDVSTILVPSFVVCSEDEECSTPVLDGWQMDVDGGDFSKTSGVVVGFPAIADKFTKLFQNMTQKRNLKSDGKTIYSKGGQVFSSLSYEETHPAYVEYVFEASNLNFPFTDYFLLDTSKYNYGIFTEAEKYALYYTYLDSIYNVEALDYEVADSVKVPWVDEETGEYAYKWIKCPKDNDTKMYLLSSSNSWGTRLQEADCVTIARQIQNTNVEETLGAVESIVDPGLGPSNGESGSAELDACHNNAGSLGWVICPLMTKLSDSATSMYERIVEPFLVVSPALVSRDSGTYTAWNVMLSIANTAMIIFFLIIIFSQLTGVGIDNYGIKKVLPKIIVVVILVNLSFLICQLLVDLSNILGNSLEKLLSEMPVNTSSLNIDRQLVDASTNAGWFKVLIFGAGAGLAGSAVLSVVGGIASEGFLAGIILPLILMLLTVVFAILFFFLLLGLRKAGIVLLVVLAPVAIVCYMLPNTKSLFDKWKKAFQGLLLLYPICGLLIGGGIMVSKIILSVSNDYMMYFTGCIIMVVPFFFIPSLLKNSFKAMGSIGARVSGIGSKLSGKATKGARESKLYNRARENSMKNAARFRAGVDKEGKVKDLNGFQRFIRGGKRGMASARSQYLKDQDTKRRENNLMGAGFEAAKVAQEKGAEADDISNYMTLINKETNNGADETELQNQFDKYASDGNKAGAMAAMRIAGRRKDTASRFMDNTLLNKDKNYDPEMISGMAKEIAEGASAGNFRASSPLGFEYASQLNSGQTKDSYADWVKNSKNVDSAMNHHITDSSQLVGVQRGNLEKIAGLMESGGMSKSESDRLRSLARDTIANRGTTGIWDSTKERELYRIAGMDYQGGNSAPVVGEGNGTQNVGVNNPDAPRPIITSGGNSQEIPQELQEELDANGIQQGDPEYDQFLAQHGIKVRDNSSFSVPHEPKIPQELQDELTANGIQQGDPEYEHFLAGHGIKIQNNNASSTPRGASTANNLNTGGAPKVQNRDAGTREQKPMVN